MGLLDSFERGLERAVNGAFARTFRSGLQPVEITAAIRREMDVHARPVARDRILAPNVFTVRMSREDHAAMQEMGRPLLDELTGLAAQHAAQQRYHLASPPVVDLEADPAVAVGMLEVTSQSVQREVVWTPVLEVDGRRHAIGARTVIGRGAEADLPVDDAGISRAHLEVRWDGRRAEARDLGSTNGSTLNGARFTHAVLTDDSVLQIGRTRLVFRLVPQGTA